MYKYPFFLSLVVIAVLVVSSIFSINKVQTLTLENQTLTQEKQALIGKVVAQGLSNDSLKSMLSDFSQTLTRYQELLREVGVLVQRQCPEMFKHQKEHGPVLRRPQSLPDPEDLPKPAPKVEI